MAGELYAIQSILDFLVEDSKAQDRTGAFERVEVTNHFVIQGVVQAGTRVQKEFVKLADVYDLLDDLGSIEVKPMSNREIILASRYAYRDLALSLHHTLTEKAVNFKTTSFQVSGLTERAKEIMRIVWWCDGEIQRIADDIDLHPEDENGYITGNMGVVREMSVINNQVHY